MRNFEQKISLGRGFVNVSGEYRRRISWPPGYRRSRGVTHVDFHTGPPLRSAPTPSGNSTHVRNIGHSRCESGPAPGRNPPPMPATTCFPGASPSPTPLPGHRTSTPSRCRRCLAWENRPSTR
ncbi:conserved hypothetical protein [Streptomyces sviceus ATCC 29083]|uniref:Uncharacterized protein n=1 Tax=Streptomyces sviceus (strain ATCC 29083 / DSM 924 / JCM 4929 / NBRC 13980 / NCIMB 11184 / NRRL 5439 / UC 5370) TaxID=463191 RepID=B5HRM7_STRX2|nr:conserved hypothetical protein [Streptomyces sviceus ATCC 29083]